MEYLTFTIKVSSDFLSNENFFDLFSLLGCSSSSSVGNFSSPDSVSVKKIGILLTKLFWPIMEKIEIRGWMPRVCKNFEMTRTIYSNSERPGQFLVFYRNRIWRTEVANRRTARAAQQTEQIWEIPEQREFLWFVQFAGLL